MPYLGREEISHGTMSKASLESDGGARILSWLGI